MDVKTLCLGVLSFGDASGYEIKKLFEDAFSHFYVAGFGSIYPALAELIEQGMVTCTDVQQDKRPAKKVYSLTQTGRDYFSVALAETYPSHRVRSDFMVQMVFAHMLSAARLEEVLQQRMADIEAELEHIARCRADNPDMAAGGHFATGFARAVLSAGLAYIRDNRAAFLDAAQHRTDES